MMKRRIFLNTLGLATAGLFWPGKSNLVGAKKSSQDANELAFNIKDDGSFDLFLGSQCILADCYPAMDNKTITPLSVSVEKSHDGARITYQTLAGHLVLNLTRDQDSVLIRTKLVGFAIAPHWVVPLAQAKVVNASHFFKQGLGFGGPSGVFPIPRSTFHHDQNNIHEQAWSYDSFMVAALIQEDRTTVAIAAYRHDNYLQRTTIYNRTHRTGLVDKHPASDEIVLFEIGFATEEIPIHGTELVLPDLHLIAAANPFAALHHLAGNIAAAVGVALDKPPSYHWDSWYEYYEDFDGIKLDNFLKGMQTIKPRMDLNCVLIDAGWCPLGDWLEASASVYPEGLESTVKKIKAHGYNPGIWLGPFMVSSASKLYKNHPDWILKKNDGAPLLDSKGDKGLVDSVVFKEERYYLDTSHPDAFAYLINVFRTFKSWGITVYKTDFLDWGFKDSVDVQRYVPGKTSVQYFTDVIKMMSQELGKESFIIGCITPFAPMIGYIDAMRLAYDNSERWSDNTCNVFNELYAGHYMHNVLWTNDPDVVFLRRNSTNYLSDAEVTTLALWAGMLGGVVATSDRLYKLPQFRFDLWNFIRPDATRQTVSIPFWFDPARKQYVLVLAYEQKNAWAILVINPTNEPVEESFDLAEVITRDQAFCFEWQVGSCRALGIKKALVNALEPHHSILYYLNEKDMPPPADLGLSGQKMKHYRLNK